ncbi:hypothetical protein ACFXPA_46535 [Amycolatopsis sp. NPDC059090]|uniref:hypothetical protein n=1 Tax=unclassified Amycolatopsis TaxID=2618356 RepID=UPI003670A0B4
MRRTKARPAQVARLVKALNAEQRALKNFEQRPHNRPSDPKLEAEIRRAQAVLPRVLENSTDDEQTAAYRQARR